MSTKIAVKNTNAINFLKVTVEKKGTKDEKWKKLSDRFFKPGESEELWLDHDSQRVILEEMPS